MNTKLINKMQETITLSKFKTANISFKNMTFKDIVHHLRRPYIYLNDDEYKYIYNLNADVVEYEGQLFTFGNCDGNKMALMPYEL